MTLSPAGIEELKKSEALRLKAYQDQTGKWTIGYGHTGKVGGVPVQAGMTITKEQADELFKQRLPEFENAINNNVKANLSQNQFDSLTSLAYNIGAGGFAKSSIVGHLNNGNYQGAADAILQYSKSRNAKTRELEFNQGLYNRRQRERALFLGEDSFTYPEQMTPQQNKQLVQPMNIGEQMASTFTSATQPLTSLGGLEPLNTLDQLTEPQTAKTNYREQYQNQLANAFGVEPEMKNAIPDYIGDLVRSIYDQT